MSNDLADFRNFFDHKGVIYKLAYQEDSENNRIPQPHFHASCPGTIISVAQAHFLFDVDGKYTGVLSDEMDEFFPIQPNIKEIKMKCLHTYFDQQHGERTEEISVESAKERIQTKLNVDQKEAERLMHEACETDDEITLGYEEVLCCEPV